ncbi:MAG: CoB--CoM heterodisulfide reductase iron-sulfur subunit A family protein [Candidatus Methanospirare jalkutatii]|nr:MAG: CoB--CoM heterodisulfide reductase iron-sulfur subunit A family protein [Candidatus Methanospirare jalkutatii]UYZ40130.1 MAG: CoB--CoM heterodisulfide reductase iron-sulfur subunit A family protein [Candidatus Methanospirare jalkutatii]
MREERGQVPHKRAKDARIGVYICHCGSNIAGVVDVKEVVDFACSLPNVIIARDYEYMCSKSGQEIIKKDIKDLKLNKIVVAACSPHMHEHTFRACCASEGLKCVEIANIREQCSWVHPDRKKATEKAKEIVRAAVFRVALLEPLSASKRAVVPRALVLGGGIAGITASLELANMGFHVYLVEKSTSIGGHMAQLDKTFPTLDCSACILTPKMSEIEHNENIELFTNAEVEHVEGSVGDFTARIRVRSRFVSATKCRGCISECAEHCPVEVESEFDVGKGKRKAIFIAFPQAVPLVATIDPRKCIGCRLCELACEFEAVDFYEKDRVFDVNVGAIIVATGFKLFDARKEPKYGYGKFKEVLTALEFERLSNASGPTGGKIIVNGREPKRVVFISCVGSRSEERPYCSRICCMYIMKQAHLIKEKIPDADITVLYTDVRAYGDCFEEFYQRVRSEGVSYLRRELEDEIEVRRGERGEVVVCARGSSYSYEIPADLVVLATAVEPSEGTREIAEMLRIPTGRDGFFLEAHPKLRPVETLTEGIFIAGCCQSPKDISESVAQASAAASKVASLLAKGEIEVEPAVATVDEMLCSGCGVCVAVCPFNALEMLKAEAKEKAKEKQAVVSVQHASCKGCGSCASACPSKAITVKNQNDEQFFAQIDAILL